MREWSTYLYADVKLPFPTVGYGKGYVTSSSTAVSGTVVYSVTGSSLAPDTYLYVVHITSNLRTSNKLQRILLKIPVICHTANCILSVLCLHIGVLSAAYPQSNLLITKCMFVDLAKCLYWHKEEDTERFLRYQS